MRSSRLTSLPSRGGLSCSTTEHPTAATPMCGTSPGWPSGGQTAGSRFGTDADGRLLAERLAQAADYLRGKGRSGLLWVFEDLPEPAARAGLASTVDRAGLALGLTGFGMAGVLSNPTPKGVVGCRS